ncbi:MAG: arginase family protein [Nocardioidaceae bacterium]|nr:arginase family protein [Nocardioidaceae bacterium]
MRETPWVATELGTFAGVPRATAENRWHARAAIVGLPFDMGTNPARIGCRQGPDHIRRSSSPDRRFLDHSPRDLLRELAVVDFGNVAVVPSRVEESFARIEAAVGEVLATGAVPVTLGGDGSVSLPVLRAAHARLGPLAVLHVDAHTDAFDVPGTGRYTTATTFLRAEEEGLLATVVHVGARGLGLAPRAEVLGTRGLHQVITTDELCAAGPAEVAARVREALGDRPAYLCWDMDFFDPASAPGVAAPEWGGPDTRTCLDFLRALAPLSPVVADINTVSPPHDSSGLTGNLAARVVFECLNLIGPPVRAAEPAGRSSGA